MKTIFYFFLVSFCFLGCSYHKEKFPKQPEEQLSSAAPTHPIQPLSLTFSVILDNGIKSKCYGCHLPHNTTSDIRLNSYKELVDGKLVVPGDPENSSLYQAVKDDYMPMSGEPLTADQKALLYKWILEGAKP